MAREPRAFLFSLVGKEFGFCFGINKSSAVYFMGLEHLILCSKSRAILFCANAVNNDWHEAVVNTAKLATLAVECTGAIDVEAYLVKAAGAAVHFHTKSRDSSAV